MHIAEFISLEPPEAGDSDEIARLYRASRADALPYLRRVHTENEIFIWIRDVVLTRGEIWVSQLKGDIVGFMTLVGDDLDQPYVMPG